MTMMSCKKDKIIEPELNNCVALAEAYTVALTAYIYDPSSTEKCEAFLQAAQDYIDGCDILTPEQKAEIQEQIDNADCSNK
jgi:hypothetical protein